MKNPNKLNLIKINGSVIPFLVDKQGMPHKEINEYLEELNNLGNSSSTIISYARMLSLFLWYCSIMGISYLDIKEQKDTLDDLLEDFAAWLRQDETRSEKRIIKISQLILWFYRFYFSQMGDIIYLQYIDTLIERRKLLGVALRRGSVRVDRPDRIKDEELALLLKAANNQRDRLILHLIFAMGITPKEITRLRWQDIDLTGQTIKVYGPKTKTFAMSGFRVVNIPAEIIKLFGRYKKELINNKRLDSEHVFLARVHLPKPISYDCIMSLLRLLSQKTKLNLSLNIII